MLKDLGIHLSRKFMLEDINVEVFHESTFYGGRSKMSRSMCDRISKCFHGSNYEYQEFELFSMTEWVTI